MGVGMRSRRHTAVRDERRVLSVRSRIVVTILLVAALGLLASGVATFFVQRQRALSQVDTDLVRSVTDLKAVASRESPQAKTVDQLLRDAIQQNAPAQNESVLGIIDGKAALMPAGSLPFRMDEDKALVQRFVSEAHPPNVVMGTAKTPTATIRYIIVPVSVAGDTSTGLYIAAYDLDAILQAIAESFQIYAFVAAGALIVIGVVAWFVAGRLLRPLRLLGEAAARNSARDLTQRIPVTGNDDISRLTATINLMFDRLEQSFTAQRRLLDDVGHELKTPITIVRGHLELMDATQQRDVEATRELAIDELDRMNELVAQISLLAESRGPGFVVRRPVDLEELTTLTLAKASVLAPARPWSIEGTATGEAELDIHRVTQAWLQLAENAVKYSTPGGAIRLGSGRAKGRLQDELRFWVRDEGPGIAADERARVFERFVRLDASRDANGSGLGLAIVSAIVSAHGGGVELSTSPHGSTFTMRIPVSPGIEPAHENDRREESE
ncbi:sensor histidine kinase [Rathayibacter soli]|uniref:sensor histidine kinase n=1 Tax=Rathayibacter soli TaxID=3144168 RepID=UPI0027E580E8|nr:HAMP domain-containing sensor histidine kinase [Glaciibacter superstes]